MCAKIFSLKLRQSGRRTCHLHARVVDTWAEIHQRQAIQPHNGWKDLLDHIGRIIMDCRGDHDFVCNFIELKDKKMEPLTRIISFRFFKSMWLAPCSFHSIPHQCQSLTYRFRLLQFATWIRYHFVQDFSNKGFILTLFWPGHEKKGGRNRCGVGHRPDQHPLSDRKGIRRGDLLQAYTRWGWRGGKRLSSS